LIALTREFRELSAALMLVSVPLIFSVYRFEPEIPPVEGSLIGADPAVDSAREFEPVLLTRIE